MRAPLPPEARPAAPRARRLGTALFLAAAPVLGLGAVLLLQDPVPAWGPAAVLGTLLGSTGAWLAWRRLQGAGRPRGPAER